MLCYVDAKKTESSICNAFDKQNFTLFNFLLLRESQNLLFILQLPTVSLTMTPMLRSNCVNSGSEKVIGNLFVRWRHTNR